MKHPEPKISQKIQINTQNFVYERKGKKVEQDYQILQTMGKGAFGEVKKVVQKITKDVRAMKIIKKDCIDDNFMQIFANEVKILRSLDHPNIVKLYEIY